MLNPDCSLPVPTFLNKILSHLYELYPPKDLKEAQQGCEAVERVLGTVPDTIYILQDKQGFYTERKVVNPRARRLGPRGSKISLWWAQF